MRIETREQNPDYAVQSGSPDGNVLSYDSLGSRMHHSYDRAGQLLSQTGLGAKSYAYDANGNQTRAGERSFAYDQANRMVSTTLATETTAYRYDGDGKRLRAGPTNILWDLAHALPEPALERDPAGATLRRYAYGSELLSMQTAGQERYFHTDALGS
ncbi:MAG: hypothetical protein ACT4P5_19000, partial [Armatimonadota bacterium]